MDDMEGDTLEEKREALYDQLLVGSTAIYALRDYVERYGASKDELDDFAEQVSPFLTDNQQEKFYNVVKNIKEAKTKTEAFYEQAIKGETEEETISNVSKYLEESGRDLEVKDCMKFSYGVVIAVEDGLEQLRDNAAGFADKFYWHPEEEVVMTEGNKTEVVKQHTDGMVEREMFSNELEEIDFFAYDVSSDSRMNNVFRHESSHLFDELFEYEPEEIDRVEEYAVKNDISPLFRVIALKKSLRREAVAYLTNFERTSLLDKDPNLFIKNRYRNPNEAIEDQLERMKEEGVEELEVHDEYCRDNNNIPEVIQEHMERGEDPSLKERKDRVRSEYKDLKEKIQKNKEKINEARNLVHPHILPEIVRNTAFDKIPKRLPKVMERFEEKDAGIFGGDFDMDVMSEEAKEKIEKIYDYLPA